MKIPKKIQIVLAAAASLVLFFGCEQDYFAVPPKPKKAQQTEKLEVAYTATVPQNTTSSVWKNLDYVKAPLSTMSSGNLYGDGLLNMTGTYGGLSDFNGGNTKDMTIKAAYNDSNLYIWMEWEDYRLDISSASALWNGPADPKKTDDATGWTSQRNSDQVALAFDIDNAAGQGGTFASAGCAASCHSGGKTLTSGSEDIWDWNVALSDPMGFAIDRFIDNNGFKFDQGKTTFTRNNAGANGRSGPAYEWDGTPQKVTRNGKETTLDPTFFLLNKTPFTGDIAKGDIIYHDENHGCTGCHGENGQGGGEHGDGPAFTSPGTVGQFSRQGIIDFAAGDSHDGSSYFSPLDAKERNDLIARLRGFGGVPGYILNTPDGSSADIAAYSNVSVSKVDDKSARTKYQVMLVRKLNTGNSDDVKFDPVSGKIYVFGVAVMDKDGKNHIGNARQQMIFKPKS